MNIKKGLIKIFDNRDVISLNNKRYIINPLTDHKPITDFEMLDSVIKGILKIGDFSKVKKLYEKKKDDDLLFPGYHIKLKFHLH